MKNIFILIILVIFSGGWGGSAPNVHAQDKVNADTVRSIKACPANSDRSYNRKKVLRQFSDAYAKEIKKMYGKDYEISWFEGGLFIYDLTDPSNGNVTNDFKSKCINFINGHIYHFSRSLYPFSISQIAVLENGKVKVFPAVNCEDGSRLEDVLSYLDKKLAGNKNKEEILVRVKNYRRYGVYINFEFPVVEGCKEIPYTYEAPDARYDETKILRQFNEILNKEAPELFRYRSPIFAVLRRQAIGFFVQDLTDTSNKQTSLLERVRFMDGHVYHFAYFDAPYSFSNLAVLHNGEVKIFRAVNCDNGDEVEDVVRYVNETLKDSDNAAVIERIRNYRKYGVYASLNDISEPQCSELKIE